MKRVKRHKVKSEKPETSTSHILDPETHDLAYYIHDRVELMHQVFSVLKYKELKAIAPACIRNISLDDLQELCTEELLGISSKRLCAILDGADPPSDTESSSPSPPPENLETISLDSISSDEEILSQASTKKKKHKHRRRDSKSKPKRKRSADENNETQNSKASRAGLTVLELLELQARARAIRAQLQQEQLHKTASETVVADSHRSSESEVEIKEEPPEVVEISSEDEKPVVEELERQISQDAQSSQQPIVKRVNDMVVIAPQKPTQKIKLNRKGKLTEKDTTTKSPETRKDKVDMDKVEIDEPEKGKVEKDKGKKKKKRKKVSKDYDDNDEITLQLSDTEKMDLLEDLDRKNYDSVSSDSSDTSNDSSPQKMKDKGKGKDTERKVEVPENVDEKGENIKESIEEKRKDVDKDTNSVSKDIIEANINKDVEKEMSTKEVNQEECVTEEFVKDSSKDAEKDESNFEIREKEIEIRVEINAEEKKATNVENEIKHKVDTMQKGKEIETEKSEGEISDRESSEVEVFCISDEDGSKSKKKKKKKDKKVKKDRKSIKSDFHEGSDENFYKDNEKDLSISVTIDNTEGVDLTKDKKMDGIDKESLDDDDVQEIYEIFELSDDSSSCEEILSLDPTSTEIEALSAKIDAIGSEKDKKEENIKDIENISWKDRYLDSKKVKKVLNTANILNALRKKNIELKNKIAENKKELERKKDEEKIEPQIVEGTIEHYNTLEGSTKYVDPILPGDLKKDAKLLLKMYKKLLKYNNIDKDTKKVKKKKKNKRKDNVKDKEKVKDIVNSVS